MEFFIHKRGHDQHDRTRHYCSAREHDNHGHVGINQQLNNAHGYSARVGFDRGDTTVSHDSAWTDAAVCGNGDIHRQQYTEPDEHGDMEFFGASGSHDQHGRSGDKRRHGIDHDQSGIRECDEQQCCADGDGGHAGIDCSDAS